MEGRIFARLTPAALAFALLAGGGLARAATAPAATTAPAGAAAATPAPLAAPAVTPAPLATPAATANPGAAAGVPTPIPLPTIGPAGSSAALPYPAYGTPAPGLESVKTDGIPQTLSLKDAIAIAAARSPALTSARADVGVARAGTRLARAGLLPNLSANASSGRSYGQNRTTGVSGPYTSNSLTATLDQLIFDGGRVSASIRAAKNNETAFSDLYRRELQTLAFNVANAYYAALTAQSTTEVAVQTVKLNQVQEDLVTAQVRAGAAARTDIATAQLPTAQARVALVRAQGAELSSYAALANVLGLDANVDVKPIDDTTLTDPAAAASTVAIPTYQQAVARALLLRPDYDASVQSVAAARASLRSARAGFFPTLSGSASDGTSSTDTAGGTYRNSGSIGANLAIPIFNGGQTAASSAQAQASLDKAQASLETTRLGIQLNVKQTLIGLVSARAALDQAQFEYDKAVEVLKATQAQYAAGVTTLPLLLSAQVGLTQALSDRVTTVYGVRTAEQALIYALGTNI
jgi:outer membrane protein